MPTPSTQSGGVVPAQMAMHVAHKARAARLYGACPPAAKQPRQRPVSPFIRAQHEIVQQKMEAIAEATQPKHHLFSAPIIEIDDEGHPLEPESMPSWKRIAREVCRKYHVTMAEMISPRRSHYICIARYEAFWRCREETTMSLPQIGRRFGNRDHTTVLHGIRRHEERIREAATGVNEPLRGQVEAGVSEVEAPQ